MTYGNNVPREIDYNGTKVINAFQRYTFEIPDRPYPLKNHGEVIYKSYYRPGYLEDYSIRGKLL